MSYAIIVLSFVIGVGVGAVAWRKISVECFLKNYFGLHFSSFGSDENVETVQIALSKESDLRQTMISGENNSAYNLNLLGRAMGQH